MAEKGSVTFAIDTSAFRRAAVAAQRLSRALALSVEHDRLRRHALHFATPGWQRPYWRLRSWYVGRQLARL